ncbi:MAG: FIST N-terminal domain-containing protein [Sedimentisphaerales bacterium]
MKLEQNIWAQKTGWQPSAPGVIGKSAQLVLVFGSTDLFKQAPLPKELTNAYPDAHFVGCSTAGEICGTTVYDDSLTTVAVHFEKTTVKTHEVEVNSVEDSFLAGERLAAIVNPANLSHLFVLSKGVNINGSELVKGLEKNLPESVIVTGGLAGDGPKFQETLTFSDGVPKNNVISAIAFYGHKLKVGYGSVGGWDPFGPERIVTRSKGNVLYELDGKNALELYKQYLGEHAKGLPATGLFFPLGIRDNEATTSLVRTILATNDKEQSITFAGDVPQGFHARLMKFNYERMIDAAAQAAKNCLDTIDFPKVELAIIVSCCGRKWILKQRVEEEIEAVREIFSNDTILTGFYSYGEIAPVAGGRKCALHNETMTITAFSEA